jgi:ligand-binding SRPBCC domain-containing protein
MNKFTSKFIVKASLKKVSAFHSSTSALKKLTPPPMIIQLHTFEPLANGSIAKFTLWFGPMPLHWLAKHENVTENGFIDVQIEGPMAFWRHEHTFEVIDENQTRVIDSVQYQYPKGLQGWLIRLLFSRIGLRFLFYYRAFATKMATQQKTQS